MSYSCTIGLDLAKASDLTAVAVNLHKGRGRETLHELVQVATVPAGTDYSRIAKFYIPELIAWTRRRAFDLGRSLAVDASGNDISLIVDGGGVGSAVLEMIEENLPPRVRLVSCQYLGDGSTERHEEITNDFGEHRWHSVRIAKTDLADRTVLALEQQRIELAPTAFDHEALKQELRAVELELTPSGRAKVTHPSGTHDDRAMALLQSVHWAETWEKHEPVEEWSPSPEWANKDRLVRDDSGAWASTSRNDRMGWL